MSAASRRHRPRKRPCRWSSSKAFPGSRRWLWVGYRLASCNLNPPSLAQLSRRRYSPARALVRMSRHRSLSSLASPLDNEDLLEEILLRLSPQPSSLPRASLVCKRWRNILSDPQFLSRFRKHHQKPPLLGFFKRRFYSNPIFTTVLESPDRIPAQRFSVPQSHLPCEQWDLVSCRHGLAVLVASLWGKIIVWDPLTGRQHPVTFPRGLDYRWVANFPAAVLRDDAKDGQVHGDCFSSPFKLVLLCEGQRNMRASAWLYESATGVWGEIFSMPTTNKICHSKHNVLARNAVCWLLNGGDILAFDLERNSLDVIKKPEDTRITDYYGYIQLLRTDDSGLGLAYLSKLTIQLWERRSNVDSVVEWVLLHRTIPLDGVLPRRVCNGRKMVSFKGYDDDTNVIVLATTVGNFMLQLDSMQIRHIGGRDKICYDIFYPYTNFYMTGF